MHQPGEPSVEEILDSIKKVIARDNRAGAMDARRRRERSRPDDSRPLAQDPVLDEEAEEVFDKMFQPFFSTKEQTQGGLGLGLSISYGIVESFDGTLSAANHPDGGAVFTLWLHRASPTANATPTALLSRTPNHV